MAKLRMSLFPTQIVANVGCTSKAFCTIVLPPRMICISGLALCEPVPPTEVGSTDLMPGTATLFSAKVADAAVRRAQVVDVPFPTRACVEKFAMGGVQPGFASAGNAYRVP